MLSKETGLLELNCYLLLRHAWRGVIAERMQRDLGNVVDTDVVRLDASRFVIAIAV
jgi:hypothetical protein